MPSFLLRILLASLGTVLASLGAFLITFHAMTGPATERLIRHFQARQIEDALDAFAPRAAGEADVPRRGGPGAVLTVSPGGAGVPCCRTGTERSPACWSAPDGRREPETTRPRAAVPRARRAAAAARRRRPA